MEKKKATSQKKTPQPRTGTGKKTSKSCDSNTTEKSVSSKKIPRDKKPGARIKNTAAAKMAATKHYALNLGRAAAKKIHVPQAIYQAKKAVRKITSFQPNNLFQSVKHMSKGSMIVVLAGILCLVGLLAWSSWPSPSGTLSVRTDQPAVVVIDGESHGDAPIEDLKLAVGKHRIKVRHERTGDERTYVRRIKEDKPSQVKVSWNTKTKKNSSQKTGDRSHKRRR